MSKNGKPLKRKLLASISIWLLICLGLISLISTPVTAVTLAPNNPMPDDFINGTVNFTVIDNDADASYIEFWMNSEYFADLRYDGSKFWYYELNTFALEDGPYFIQYKGYKGSTIDDVYGFAVFIDNSGPELSDFEVTYPPPQEAARWNDFVTFQINAEDEFGISMVMVNCSTINFTMPVGPMYDDGLHQDEAPNDGFYGSDPFMVDTFATGTFVINVSAMDSNGNIDNKSYIIDIDNMPPTVIETNITYPPGQAAVKYGDQIRVTSRGYDMGMTGGILALAANLTSINGSLNELMYDDGLHGDDFDGDGLYGTEWVTVGSYNNGFNIIGCTAYDIALNPSLNFALINTDNNAPIVIRIKIKYPNSQGYALNGDLINVSATITDDQGLSAITRYYLDASEIGGPQQMDNTSAFRWDNIEVSTGYTRSRGSTDITVHVFDHANNEGTLSASVEVGQDIRRAPTVTVKSPNGGENWMDGDFYPITWVADGNLGERPIDLFYSTDNGETWKPIAFDIPNTGYFNWTVPTEETAGGLIRVNVSDMYGYNVSDTSDASFSIDPPPQRMPATAKTTEQSQTNPPSLTENTPQDEQKSEAPETPNVDEPLKSDPNTKASNSSPGIAPAVPILIIIAILLITSLVYLIMQKKGKNKGKTETNSNQKIKNLPGKRRI